MSNHDTTPQPFGNPLNLLYKGVFSTRTKANNNSIYGHYFDKLYQIQFLGIGTHSGDVLPDLISAVMLRQSSINSRVELYKLTRTRYNEAVVLEELGGEQTSDAAVVDDNTTEAIVEDRINGEVLYTLEGMPVSSLAAVLDHVTADRLKARPGDVMFYISVADKGHRDGSVNDDQYEAAKDIGGIIDELSKTMDKTFTDASILFDAAGKVTKHAELTELKESQTGNEEAIIVTGTEAIMSTQSNVGVLDDPFTAYKLKVAEHLLEVLAEKSPTKDAVLLIDSETMGTLLRDAEIMSEMLYVAERIGQDAIIHSMPVEGVSVKEASLAHYILFDVDRDYQMTVLEYLDIDKVDHPVILEGLKGAATRLLDRYKGTQDETYIKAQELVKEYSTVSESALRKIMQGFDGGGMEFRRGPNQAELKFDHDIRLEESVRYMDVLDHLYKDFTKAAHGVGVATTITGIVPNPEALIVQEFLGERQVFNEGTVDSLREIADKLMVGTVDHGDQGEKSHSTPGMVGGSIDVAPTTKVEGVLHDHGMAAKTSVETHTELSLAGEGLAITETISHEHIEAHKPTKINSDILTQDIYRKSEVNEMHVLDGDEHGEMWSDQVIFAGDSREQELFGELVDSHETMPVNTEAEYLAAEMTHEKQPLSYDPEMTVLGDLTSEPELLYPDETRELQGELTSEDQPLSFVPEHELHGDLDNQPVELTAGYEVEVVGTRVKLDADGKVQGEYEIAVLGCSDQNSLKYRRRPDLEPDKLPEDPLFEWICTEGYVCEDWLIVPLKDFNFENLDMSGFYDPVTFEPYYPTGQTDELGDPYVLAPYSVLNEPLSNGEDVGGKEPMHIDPCNLYSYIQHIVKIYDAYKARFQASNPIDTMSRVMNMLFEQTKQLEAEWDISKDYTPNELWRIYRFIRWIALGVTNRFYRVKLEYTYGDLEETFEVYPFNPAIQTNGTMRRQVPNYGWVLDGRPPVEGITNTAVMDFTIPAKTNSSTIRFEVGNLVPDRPPDEQAGGILYQEDFEGVNPTIGGTGWDIGQRQSGSALVVEDPARVRTYRTTTFNVPDNAAEPFIRFNYGIDTNMNTRLELKRSGGAVVWSSVGVKPYANAIISPAEPGDYYFEVKVPQEESGLLTDLNFSAQQIQDEWLKAGYLTQWEVVGNTIYEEENTLNMAMVLNPQWTDDTEYEFEAEFHTSEDPSLYWAYDWIGFVFNYKDANNYYLVGSWSSLDGTSFSGVSRVSGIPGEYLVHTPTWRFSKDFRWKFNTWHKLKLSVSGQRIQVHIDGEKLLDVIDNQGWGHGASGLAAYSNPSSAFRNFKYRGKPRFDAFVDNVIVESPTVLVPVYKPKYLINFYLDGDETPRIRDYYAEAKRAFSFPILKGEHSARWEFTKQGIEQTIPQDASFLDSITIKGAKIVGANVVEEFISCGGHMAVRLLIENLLEYYRRHHQGCKGERNIWIVE